ncbi:TetR/AcrR family transcriptional regulator [Streptomyces sp. sk226]|uniref:TetR/AcrR family transcriptional regulator n=1 Tax=Streptomyces sp. sk226 TaxID=2034268 RepID=UPI000BF1E110|nr:TetR/AcrR family transcriptional regulator C-terminal domain-containing protein [Streptomyces sp. sk226]
MTHAPDSPAPRPAGARRGRPPSNTLSRARILDAAQAVLEGEGPEALTLRRLGADLGSNHTAVLRYFSGKDDILLGLAERLIAEAIDGFEPGPAWRDTLTALARRVRRACLAHPALAVLVASRVSRRDAEFRGADLVIGALREAGFGPEEAARSYRALVDVALAMSSFEAASAVLGGAEREGDRMAWQREYLAASPQRFPHLAAVAPFLARADEDDQFEFVMDLLLNAVEARAGQGE